MYKERTSALRREAKHDFFSFLYGLLRLLQYLWTQQTTIGTTNISTRTYQLSTITMRTSQRFFSAIASILLMALPSMAQTPYFIQTFEDTIPSKEDVTTPLHFQIEGQGEWVFYNCFKGTNTNYIKDGSNGDLRMVKSGLNGPGDSYVITPVFDRGVKKITFDEGRTKKYIDVSVSKDGGQTWTSIHQFNKDTQEHNTVEVNDIEVNRVRLSNYNTKNDCDVDNLAIYPEATGTPATVVTGEASDVTKTTARLSGEVTDTGDQEILHYGICWNYEGAPVYTDNPTQANKYRFTVDVEGLIASHTIYYRAYAFTRAGVSYGETRTFQTADATMPIVHTKDITINRHGYYVTGGEVTDDGGLPVIEQGILYATTSGLSTQEGIKVTASPSTDNFTVRLPLESHTTYYYRAYCQTEIGTGYGEERSYTTGEVVPPSFTGNIIWCSPTGDDRTANGSEEAPFYSLQKAADIVEPGDTIYMMAGTYTYDARVNINTCATAEKPIALYALGGRAVLDFSAMPYHKHSDNPYQGVRLCGSYWHFYRIDITNASDNGLLIERNKPTGGSNNDILNATEQAHDNIIEDCRFYRNGDTGLQMKNLASFNYVINCDSYLNCDEDQGDADGFAPKLSVGDGNYFYGCRAWANSDDGWDVFFKKDGGFSDNVSIIIENSIAYKNGFLDLEHIAPDGNGNGFKMGSNQGAMNVLLNRCLAICNKAKGFDQNHNAGDIIMNNCTGMTLKSISEKTYSYRIYEEIASGHTVKLTNCIAINDNAATNKVDKNTGKYKEGEDGKYGDYGRFEVDSTLTGMQLQTCEFHAADPSQFIDITNHEELIGERTADGELPFTTFAHLKEGSFLIDRGTPVDSTIYRGIPVGGIRYHGERPDLGAYESDYGEQTTIRQPNGTAGTPFSQPLRLIQTQGGLVIVTADLPSGTRSAQLSIHDTAGRLLMQHDLTSGLLMHQGSTSTTTAIRLPQTKGTLILRITTPAGYVATAKLAHP